MGRRVVAIDCDLNELYAWDSRSGEVCSGRFEVSFPVLIDALHQRDLPLVLFEIASPLDYTDNKAVAHQKRRWTIHNVNVATRLDAQVRNVLVAPSHAWTRGYPAETRQRLAKAQGRNHDLRECEAMIWMHEYHPAPWVPLYDFLGHVRGRA